MSMSMMDLRSRIAPLSSLFSLHTIHIYDTCRFTSGFASFHYTVVVIPSFFCFFSLFFFFFFFFIIIIDKWPPYASHLTFEMAKCSANGNIYVRAVYNDVPMKMYPKYQRVDNSLGDQWMRFEEFEHHLRELALTHEEYDQAVEEQEKEAALSAQAEAVVEASLGGAKEKEDTAGKDDIGNGAATLEK